MLLAAVVGVAAFIGLAYRAGWTWTGFVGATPKTLWDWLLLLLVPAGLAIVLFALNDAQNGREHRRAEHEAARADAVEADRRHAARLDAYLSQMTDLMLRHELTNADVDSPVSQIASTLTAAVLPRHPHMDLGHADFRHATLRGVFDGAHLDHADFSGAQLDGLTFKQACLRGARFAGARIVDLTLKGVHGDGIDFSRVDLHWSGERKKAHDADPPLLRALAGRHHSACKRPKPFPQPYAGR